ncbi:hypothetical protein DOTSEDRAFT_35678 [Dothistroma septosporum NZE10]|uniref:Uncharacterized protein n=1 Tax=Dothistroma septosporum (strain NZE10 / CBS 128990) TaxID=675120 RepID=M2WN25_DOTSN|nr:hypothetical protein DOTSEDRAFT_35678 [Dothistroma septosporum NZE10]
MATVAVSNSPRSKCLFAQSPAAEKVQLGRNSDLHFTVRVCKRLEAPPYATTPYIGTMAPQTNASPSTATHSLYVSISGGVYTTFRRERRSEMVSPYHPDFGSRPSALTSTMLRKGMSRCLEWVELQTSFLRRRMARCDSDIQSWSEYQQQHSALMDYYSSEVAVRIFRTGLTGRECHRTLTELWYGILQGEFAHWTSSLRPDYKFASIVQLYAVPRGRGKRLYSFFERWNSQTYP